MAFPKKLAIKRMIQLTPLSKTTIVAKLWNKKSCSHFTMTKFQKNCQIVAKCEHEFYSTLCKVCTWVLLNTLQQFHEFFLTLCKLVVFYNVNTVRSEMWVWGFPNHSCQKFLTNHSSSTRDLTRFLAFVIWKTPYSHFWSHSIHIVENYKYA